MRKPKSEGTLFAGNRLAVEGMLGDKLQATSLSFLALVVAEVLDQAAAGEDVFLTIGANRARNAYVLTVTWGGEKMYAPGLTMLAMCEAAASLLDDA